MDKGAKTADMDIIWPFKRFMDDPGLVERLVEKRRKEHKDFFLSPYVHCENGDFDSTNAAAGSK